MEFDHLELIASDIDAYHEPSNEDENATFDVDFHEIKKCKAHGLPWELNMVKCCCLSAAGFLTNNTINLTATCFEVDFSKDNCL